MIPISSITQGVVTGVATSETLKQLEKVKETVAPSGELSDTEKMLFLLAEIAKGVSPQEKFNVDIAVALQPYPYEYMIDEAWFDKPHFCLFLPVATPLRMDIEGVGTYTPTRGPGWFQVDLRGRLSIATGNANFNALLSYREAAIGAAF